MSTALLCLILLSVNNWINESILFHSCIAMQKKKIIRLVIMYDSNCIKRIKPIVYINCYYSEWQCKQCMQLLHHLAFTKSLDELDSSSGWHWEDCWVWADRWFDLGQGQISSYSSCVFYITHQNCMTMHLPTYSHIWKDAEYPIKGLYWMARWRTTAQQADVRLRGSSQDCKELYISAKRAQTSPVLSTQSQYIGAWLKKKRVK